MTTREIRLAARPSGLPRDADFELAESALPEVGEGQALVRVVYASVDPYMRGRMNDARSYVPPFRIGEAIDGGAVGQVVASRSPELERGDWVRGMFGWREHAVADAGPLVRLDPERAPVSTALGVLGMPGFTAWIGLREIGRVEAGETVFVSAAAGAVGSAAGQMARILGCRTVGSAGSPEKVAYLRELGFDAAFDHHVADLPAALADAAPDGIDVYFDNVGGDHLEAALGALRLRGRAILCGAISQYNAESPVPGPRSLALAIGKRLTLRGFIVSDHSARMREFLEEATAWVAEGRLAYRETVVDGLENAPRAFIGMLQGGNVGKMLVRVSPPDARVGEEP